MVLWAAGTLLLNGKNNLVSLLGITISGTVTQGIRVRGHVLQNSYSRSFAAKPTSPLFVSQRCGPAVARRVAAMDARLRAGQFAPQCPVRPRAWPTRRRSRSPKATSSSFPRTAAWGRADGRIDPIPAVPSRYLLTRKVGSPRRWPSSPAFWRRGPLRPAPAWRGTRGATRSAAPRRPATRPLARARRPQGTPGARPARWSSVPRAAGTSATAGRPTWRWVSSAPTLGHAVHEDHYLHRAVGRVDEFADAGPEVVAHPIRGPVRTLAEANRRMAEACLENLAHFFAGRHDRHSFGCRPSRR